MSKAAEVYNGRPVTPSNQIVLLTTPVSTLKALGIKNPIDIVAHWTICINRWCYELARQSVKKFPYTYKAQHEQDWRAYRARQGKPIEPHDIGYMAMPYSHEYINEVASLVWDRSLNKKYAYDEHNCQVFVRLLIELIGSQEAKSEFPAALDRWVQAAGNIRDGSAIAVTASAILVAVGLSSLAVDPTGISAAGFGLAAQTTLRSSQYLLQSRYDREKKIKEGQKEIRKEMRQRGKPLAEPEAKK